MKVCILTTSFPLRRGDLSGLFIFDQGRYLIRQGIEVVVIAPHHAGVPKRESVEGMVVRRVRYFLPAALQKLCYGSGIPHNLKHGFLPKIQLPFLLCSFLLQTMRYAGNCDVIHAHWSLAGLAGLVASRMSGKPIVLTMHHGSTGPLTKIEKFLLEQVDSLLCNSRFTLAHVLKTARPKKTKVIPPGVDIHIFQPKPENGKKDLLLRNLPKDCLLVLTIGRLIELKGHRYLLEAFRHLPEDMHAHLLVGGDGPLRKTLENQVWQSGLSNRVTLIGQVPNDLIPLYCSLADIYVQPSIIDQEGNTEGLGVTLLEAMACETPCIGARTGGIPDIIQDGRNGYLVEPGSSPQLAEKISLLLKDGDLRVRMGTEGRRFVEENYSWDAKAKELVEIYAGLISPEGPGRRPSAERNGPNDPG